MNTKQKTKNNFSGRMTSGGIFFSFIILFFFAFIGCKEPLTPGSDIPSGKGAFSLTLSNARTVLPNTPNLSDFAIYNLSFTPVSGGTALSADRTNSTLATSPILLDPGTYNLVVSAYKNTAKTQLMAQGTLNGIVITAGKSTPAAVTLEALLSGGTGTFSYSITLSNVTTTTRTMTIRQANGTSVQTVTLNSGTTSGSLTLNSGSYNLTFNLTGSGGKTVVWREMLYVYQNLESNFTFTFTDAHFSGSNYTVTFDSNFADQGITPRSVSHGSKVTSSTPTSNFMTFSGWYTDNGTFANLYDFDTIVMESFTLYAKWDNVVPFESVTGLANKLSWLKTRAQSNGSYVLEVNADESIAPHTLSYSNRSNITVTLIGAGANRTVSLSSNGTMFTVDSGITLILGNNITLQGRSSNNNSLVRINSGGTLTMNAGSTITGNTRTGSSSDTAYYGGGIYVDSNGTFTMTGGKISGNSASNTYSSSSGSGGSGGGGVYINGGAFTMSGGEISDNTASTNFGSASGGGVYINGGTFTMGGGEISNNTARATSFGGSAYGGGVYKNSGTFTMYDGEISNNTATSSGGSAYGGGVSGILGMNGGKISNNTAIASSSSGGSAYGGGVSCGVSGTLAMNGGKISNNTARAYSSSGSAYGGGVSGNLIMNDGEISGNTASYYSPSSAYGGGVYVYGYGTSTMNGGEISGNTSTGGGGVFVATTFTMNNGKISGNTAKDSGGGVYVGEPGANATFTMNGGEISGNSAIREDNNSSNGFGGGVMLYNNSSGTSWRGTGTFRIVTGTVYGNAAAEGLRNTAYFGAALYRDRDGGVAQRGTFNGSTWVSSGDLTATNIFSINDTIRVVNGELVQ